MGIFNTSRGSNEKEHLIYTASGAYWAKGEEKVERKNKWKDWCPKKCSINFIDKDKSITDFCRPIISSTICGTLISSGISAGVGFVILLANDQKRTRRKPPALAVRLAVPRN